MLHTQNPDLLETSIALQCTVDNFQIFMTILKSYSQFDFTNICLILKVSMDLKKLNHWSAILNKKNLAFYASAISQVFLLTFQHWQTQNVNFLKPLVVQAIIGTNISIVSAQLDREFLFSKVTIATVLRTDNGTFNVHQYRQSYISQVNVAGMS